MENTREHFELARKLYQRVVTNNPMIEDFSYPQFYGFTHYKIAHDLKIGFLNPYVRINEYTENAVRFFDFVVLGKNELIFELIFDPFKVKILPAEFLKECLYYTHLEYEKIQ